MARYQAAGRGLELRYASTPLDRDLTAIPADQIAQTKVLLTIVGGKEVYRAPGYE